MQIVYKKSMPAWPGSQGAFFEALKYEALVKSLDRTAL